MTSMAAATPSLAFTAVPVGSRPVLGNGGLQPCRFSDAASGCYPKAITAEGAATSHFAMLLATIGSAMACAMHASMRRRAAAESSPARRSSSSSCAFGVVRVAAAKPSWRSSRIACRGDLIYSGITYRGERGDVMCDHEGVAWMAANSDSQKMWDLPAIGDAKFGGGALRLRDVEDPLEPQGSLLKGFKNADFNELRIYFDEHQLTLELTDVHGIRTKKSEVAGLAPVAKEEIIEATNPKDEENLMQGWVDIKGQYVKIWDSARWMAVTGAKVACYPNTFDGTPPIEMFQRSQITGVSDATAAACVKVTGHAESEGPIVFALHCGSRVWHVRPHDASTTEQWIAAIRKAMLDE
eukprot:TRINITY_DN39710_c0_g1_i1.p1 TRINITY_DN39710_c0_g1~~TRINITY_DN39710_c0_g1_i1.p1  ORF type:complete len:375 (-),score=72.79 TRINITY_DN39710_c0_g1_i1:490-1548(-)